MYNALMLSLVRTVGPPPLSVPTKVKFFGRTKEVEQLEKLARVGKNIYYVLENNIFTQSKIKISKIYVYI